MSTAKATYYLTRLNRKYFLLRLSEVCLWTLSFAGLVYGALELVHTKTLLVYSLTFFTSLLVFISRFRRLKLHQRNEQRLVRYINQRYPQLEESTDLLLLEQEALTGLQQVQREKTIQRFNTLYSTIQLPHRLRQAVALFMVSVLVTVALTAFRPDNKSITGTVTNGTSKTTVSAKLPVSVTHIEIKITPPPYTGLGSSTSSDPHLDIPAGSTVRWNIQFSDPLHQAHLVFSGGDTAVLSHQHHFYTGQRTFHESNFYQLQWINTAGETKTSDYYKIEVTKDQSPEVTINSLPQFTTLSIQDKLTLDLKSTLTDDYGIQDAYIIATVSKGSGESVKFREEKLTFTSPSRIQGKKIQASRIIDLLKLGMEPGDELYFYAEAIDTRIPLANRTRTETYFIALKDTLEEDLSVEAGLGVDLMPEYFRSQRQIIIDTEKLLKEKKQIAKQNFNAKSNTLGYDQKVLRLRYGEFLGEEFQSGIAIEDHDESAAQDQHEEEDVTKKFGHVHDQDNEHNLVPEKKAEDHHDHAQNNAKDQQENPLSTFMHMHDDTEAATFFTQSIRAKLKAALTIMWDAELYLRLYTPEKSLPYQYKALKLLKEISNDSRIYVHKTGFDPPPVKEEKRFTGDLSTLKHTTVQGQEKTVMTYPGIREALTVTEHLLHQSFPQLTDSDKQSLLRAGNELSALALARPGQYLRSLSLIKALKENEIDKKNIPVALQEIRIALWKALPGQTISPRPQPHTRHALDSTFIQNLKALKHE